MKSNLHVLIIDDDSDDAAIIQDAFVESKLNCFFVIAKSYVEALLVENGTFDLILLDYALGNKNGIALLKDPKFNRGKAKVIVLTSMDDKAARLQARARGADEFQVKADLTPDRLKAVVESLFSRTK